MQVQLELLAPPGVAPERGRAGLKPQRTIPALQREGAQELSPLKGTRSAGPFRLLLSRLRDSDSPIAQGKIRN